MFLRFLISLIFALITAKIFHYFFTFFFNSWLLTLLIGILSFYLSMKILKLIFRKKDTGSGNITPFNSISQEKSVREGMEKLKKIRNNTRMISDNGTASKVQDICRTGGEIFDYLSKNPDEVSKAKQFLNYYLDATEKIVDQYVDLSARKEKSEEIENSLKRVESMLDSIKETYTKQLHNLLENDILDLNTEISVLEKTMKLEG